MPIDRLVFLEPIRVVPNKKQTPRKIGEVIMIMYSHLAWSLDPGEYDITPQIGLASLYEQKLHVSRNGEGVLKVTSTILRINKDRPIVVQTLDGGNDPCTSPIIGVVGYRAKEI